VFQAVVNQTISGLACGRPIRGKVAFLGGPLHFLPRLRERFELTLGLGAGDSVNPPESQLFVAAGAALFAFERGRIALSEVISRLESDGPGEGTVPRLKPLFADAGELARFRERHSGARCPRGDLSSYRGPCFLGIDAGSTTTKLAVCGASGELLHSFYMNNGGNPVALALEALREARALLPEGAWIARSCATGYGEAMLRAAFGVDDGEVETIAHCQAAQALAPGVSSVVDIGGQDMKYIRLRDGAVSTILLNEACSSGCGSFIETFAHSLGYSAEAFTALALESRQPVDLGSRCTVFMNSRVKQAQKEGATVADIAAGLAYSVIRNALQKVIKLRDPDELGQRPVAQGGTFSSDAILRAFELVAGREATRPDVAGLMGAYGAALLAKRAWKEGLESTLLSAEALERFEWKANHARCPGCANACPLTISVFESGGASRRLVTGNRCERAEAFVPSLLSGDREAARGAAKAAGERASPDAIDLYAWKLERVFAYRPRPASEARFGEVGIPRVLNMYENYPLWFTFFHELGFSVALSPRSSKAMYEKGMDTIPSESVCYPGKLAHGHARALVDRGIPFVFYPCAPYEAKLVDGANNHFNCPIVTSYPEVLLNNVEEFRSGGILYRNPFVPLHDPAAFADRLVEELSDPRYAERGIVPREREIRAAAAKAWEEQERFRAEVRAKGEAALAEIERRGMHGIVLAGRPYHVDPEIHHGISELVVSLGMAALTEDSIAHLGTPPRPLRVVDQWTYHSRLYAAAAFVARRADLDLVQLNSFGCGLDAVTTDQVEEILEGSGRVYTCIKIDEQSNLGAARIRLRSLAAAIEERRASGIRPREGAAPAPRPLFTREMRASYTILAPQMSPIHFSILERAFRFSGYNLVVPEPETGPASGANALFEHPAHAEVDEGLRSVNNDACYPSILVTGQLLSALKSGRYPLDRVALLITQTGGGCRATNYIAFIRKAIKDAGFGHVPVISLSAGGLESNPGFRVTWPFLKRGLMGLVYGDVLMRALYRVRPYELAHGSADALASEWSGRCSASLERPSWSRFSSTVRAMVRAFDELPIAPGRKPRVGVVGEILVKFHPTANNDIVDAIEAEGAEAVMPDLADFLFYSAYGNQFRRRYLGGSLKAHLASRFVIWALERFRSPARKALRASARFTPPESIYTLAKGVDGIVQLGNMTGEGWFLTAEMVELVHSGVDGIACVQPFACLPNHVTGKGMIKELRRRYPDVAVAAIDYDPGASEVNQANRLKLLLAAAKANFARRRADGANGESKHIIHRKNPEGHA
jgi:predicted CoA-substrate-specific enzyme activase